MGDILALNWQLRIHIPSSILPRIEMPSKRQKVSSKKIRKVEEPGHEYDHEKFVSEGAADKFGVISKNMSFIKEKGFQHVEDFFRKTIDGALLQQRFCVNFAPT